MQPGNHLAKAWAMLFAGFFFGGMGRVIAQLPQEGMASYYADRFEGKPTASGELYHKAYFTAAHRTLPFGTLIRVTNTRNGKSVIVKVNDRGPHKEDRVVDLSRAAAEQIGLIQAGIALVRVEAANAAPEPQPEAAPPAPPGPQASVPPQGAPPTQPDRPAPRQEPVRIGDPLPPSPTGRPQPEKAPEKPQPAPAWGSVISEKSPPLPPEGKRSQLFSLSASLAENQGFALQVGSFDNIKNAMNLADRLGKDGFPNQLLEIADADGRSIIRVLIGPYATAAEASREQSRLKARKIDSALVNLSTR